MYSKIYESYKFYPVIYNNKRLFVGDNFICYNTNYDNDFIITHLQDTQFSFMKTYGEKFKMYIIALTKEFSKNYIYKYFNCNYRDANIKLIHSITFNYNNYNYNPNTISFKENLLTIYELKEIFYHILPDELINIVYNYLDHNNTKFRCNISFYIPKKMVLIQDSQEISVTYVILKYIIIKVG